MENTKVTAQILENAGWTEKQVKRYYKILNRKIKNGHSALTIADRRFYNSAQDAARKTKRQRQAALVEGAKSTPIQGKLHHRYMAATLIARKASVNLAPYEVSAHVIINEVHLEVLEKLRPTLDMCDTSQRHQIYLLAGDFLEMALSLEDARPVQIDRQALINNVKKELKEDWNERFEEDWLKNPNFDDVVFYDGEEDDFRKYVRSGLENAMIKAFRSLRKVNPQ